MNTETIIIKTAHGDMQTFVAYPDSSPSPCILVLQEAFGVNNHIKDIAVRFAKEGYLAVAPELYYRTAPPGFAGSYEDFMALKPHFSQLTPENLQSDLNSILDWIKTNPKSIPDRIASIGYCLGGWVSFFANSIYNFKAAISYYGSRIVQTSEEYSPKQNAPLLLVWAGQDRSVKPTHIAAISELLKSSGKNYVELVFSEAEHGFFCDARAAYHKTSAAQAWAITLAFLKEHL